MRLTNFRLSTGFRLSRGAALLPAAAIVLAACGGGGGGGGGGGDEAPDPTAGPTTAEGDPIPTATPFAIVPEPIIVTDADAIAAAAEPLGAPVAYVVEAGDSLSAIADRYDTTVEAIMEANGLTDPRLIFVDQELVIPGPNVLASSPPAPAGGASASETGLTTYVVQAGDTALAIAFQFDVSLEELAAANGTTVDSLNNLNVGDELVIPS